jgi:hypothetical protein
MSDTKSNREPGWAVILVKQFRGPHDSYVEQGGKTQHRGTHMEMAGQSQGPIIISCTSLQGRTMKGWKQVEEGLIWWGWT